MIPQFSRQNEENFYFATSTEFFSHPPHPADRRWIPFYDAHILHVNTFSPTPRQTHPNTIRYLRHPIFNHSLLSKMPNFMHVCPNEPQLSKPTSRMRFLYRSSHAKPIIASRYTSAGGLSLPRYGRRARLSRKRDTPREMHYPSPTHKLPTYAPKTARQRACTCRPHISHPIHDGG